MLSLAKLNEGPLIYRASTGTANEKKTYFSCAFLGEAREIKIILM